MNLNLPDIGQFFLTRLREDKTPKNPLWYPKEYGGPPIYHHSNIYNNVLFLSKIEKHAFEEGVFLFEFLFQNEKCWTDWLSPEEFFDFYEKIS